MQREAVGSNRQQRLALINSDSQSTSETIDPRPKTAGGAEQQITLEKRTGRDGKPQEATGSDGRQREVTEKRLATISIDKQLFEASSRDHRPRGARGTIDLGAS